MSETGTKTHRKHVCQRVSKAGTKTHRKLVCQRVSETGTKTHRKLVCQTMSLIFWVNKYNGLAHINLRFQLIKPGPVCSVCLMSN